MEKYITIRDIAATAAYRNKNAVLVYIHLCCSMDVVTRLYIRSVRMLAADMGMTVATVRCALDLLEECNLIVRDTTHLTTHPATQPTTHIYVVKPNELEGANNTPNDTPNDTAHSTRINYNNKQKEAFPTHDARACVGEKLGEVVASLGISEAEVRGLLEEFVKRQALKGKSWTDQGDVVSHFISWSEKRLPRKAAPPKGKAGDHGARMEEYQRTQEEEALKEQKVKEWEEVTRVWGWWQEAVKKKEKERAAQQYDAYMLLRGRWEAKWKKVQ